MKKWMIAAALLSLLGCKEEEAKANGPGEKATAEKTGPQQSEAPPEAPASADAKAEIGKPAPGFELPAVGGGKVSLDQHKGKVVVLEWFNPGCPFVKYAHGEGPLKDAAKKYAEKGVVWIAINSNAKGTQGHGEETNKEAKEKWSMDYPLLLDESGRVGKMYGAERTPHMYVIDAKGNLVYRGALDNSGGAPPDPELKYQYYLEQALEAVLAGKPVPEPTETKAWGCTVKYASR